MKYKPFILSFLSLLIPVMLFAGGGTLQLTDDPEFEMYGVCFPDGESVIFSNQYDDLHWKIYSVDLEGSLEKVVVSPGNGTYFYPDVSPDGEYICYSTGEDNNAMWEIALYKIGGDENILTNNASEGLDSHYPVFNTDGTRIAYVKRDNNTYTDTLMVMNADGTDKQKVCTLYTGATEMVYDMDWLNNTDYIIFTNYDYELYKVEAKPGAVPERISVDSEFHTCFSNLDGSLILCAESDYDEHERYITIKPDGSEKTIIANLESLPEFLDIYCQICWLPDETGMIGLGTFSFAPDTRDLFILDESRFIEITEDDIE